MWGKRNGCRFLNYLSVHLSFWLICLSISLFNCLSIHLGEAIMWRKQYGCRFLNYLSIHLSILIYMSILHLRNRLAIYLSKLSWKDSVYLSIYYLSISLFNFLSNFLFIYLFLGEAIMWRNRHGCRFLIGRGSWRGYLHQGKLR